MTENIKYIETSIGLIPSDWKVEKLGSLGNLNGGGTPSTANLSFWNGNIPWISSSDLDESSIYKIKENRFITNEAIKNSATKLIPKNSILIVSRVGVGKVAITNKNICTSQDFTSLTLKTDNCNYFGYLIKFKINKLLEFNQGTSIKGFVKSDLEALLLPIPPVAEQQEIAKILFFWDNAIDNCNLIIENLKVRNNELTKQLLSGKIRVKGFTEKWKTMKLSDFSNNRNSSLSINNLESNIGQFPLYGANRIIQRIDFFESEDPYISIIKDGAGVGRVFLCEGKSSIVGTMAYIKSNEKSTLNFLFHLLKLIKFESFITGSTIPHIYYSSYGKKRFDIPNIEEQKAIANILDKATQELKQFEQKLQTLQLQKKGLMQQLLTGKTRVKIS